VSPRSETLKPGQPATSGAALARLTGFSVLTCRKALRALLAEDTLAPGPSRNARSRVAAPGGPGPAGGGPPVTHRGRPAPQRRAVPARTCRA